MEVLRATWTPGSVRFPGDQRCVLMNPNPMHRKGFLRFEDPVALGTPRGAAVILVLGKAPPPRSVLPALEIR
eukprot:7625934-Alexandrium_andersonii.AAC.1